MASVEGGILRSGQGSVRNGERGGRGYCEAGSEVASGGDGYCEYGDVASEGGGNMIGRTLDRDRTTFTVT